MHDFLLAKEIIDELKKIAVEKKIENIKKVSLGIGLISLAHDGHSEHTEDVSMENLEFGLKNISKNTPFENTEFEIKKTAGNSWKIISVKI
ncbi:MAG TPA: hypothetical protein DCS28_01130 [Candidatus Moranbacteria bacterium]|nr:hypothetical protein [Candidatus Moranbacteria bacterium]HAT74632.1 hypothetical protein [Candidatus Moranbacteria bacterium]